MRFQFKSDASEAHALSMEHAANANADAGQAHHGPSEETAGAPKKILILSVSAGAGHVRAAEAIRAYSAIHHAHVESTHLDVMNYVSSGFRKIYTDFYIALISKHPALWGYLYQVTNEAMPNSRMQKLRRGIERLSTRKLLREIRVFNPDTIICTHFLPAELLSRMARTSRLPCPVWVQVTDFDLHRMWVHEGMTGYFAANDEVAYRMQAHGIPVSAIHVTGIPVMPAFGQALDRAVCASELGLDPMKPTLLLMGGGAGLGKLDEIAARLLSLDSDFQLIVLAGRNEDTLATLRALSIRYPDRLVACGFTNHVERLMACADLAITKSGGLTTAECLAMGLPMIVNSPIPGQEERNADYLLEQGAALKAFDPVTLEYRIRHVLQNPHKLDAMRASARMLGQPAAGRRVLDIVLANSKALTV